MPQELVRFWAAEDADRPAVRGLDGTVISYGALEQRISALAKTLQAQGIGTGSQVALSFPNSVAFVVWISAVWRVGGCVVSLDPRLSPREATALLNESGVDLHAALPSLEAEKLVGWAAVDLACDGVEGRLWRRIGDPTVPQVPLLPDTVIRRFTSGSTGAPKHVLHSAANLHEDYSHLTAPLHLGEQERYIGAVPFFHAFGGLGLLAALAHGAEILILTRFMPGDVLTLAQDFRPTLLFATPVMIEALATCFATPEDIKGLAELGHIILATGRLGQAHYDAFSERYGVIAANMFGSSETLSIALDMQSGAEEGRVGIPLPNVRVEILGADDQPLRLGQIGRVAVHSPANGVSFAGPDRLTPEGAPTLTGDRGYLTAAGELYLVGRDDVINIGGYKVDRHEVEDVIRKAFPVTHVAVVKTERAGQPALRAVIEADPADVTAEAVIAVCRAQLVDYKVPARIEIYPELLRDGNGKVRMADLQSLGVTTSATEEKNG